MAIFKAKIFECIVSFNCQRKGSYKGNSMVNKMNEITVSEKKKWIAATLSFFLGMFGIHRFYLGRNASGAIMLVACILGILIPILGWFILFVEAVFDLVDFVRILINKLPDAQGRKLC